MAYLSLSLSFGTFHEKKTNFHEITFKLWHHMSTSEHNTFLAFTTSIRRFEWAQFHFRLASSSHTTRSHSLSHFIIIIKSFLFSFLLNVFILFILIMFCFNLTESNITLHIFFDTSKIIFLNWRDEKTNHKKRTRSQPKPPFNVTSLQQVPQCNPTQNGMNSQPPAMLHYVCQWTPTKWKQLQQLHAATNQIHEVLMIWLGRDKIHSTNTLNIWRMSLCTLTRIVVWCARRLDRSIFLNLKIIRNRKFKKEFKNDILYNSLFNLLFSLVNSFSLLSLCIFEGTSFWL